MADQSRAITWILTQAPTLNLKIERYSWIEEILPGWTDVHCTIDIRGETLHGWGAGSSEDLALCKAFAEAAERAVIISTDAKTSNGFAAHLSPGAARQNAIRELIERDLFLSHFYTKTPFQSLSPRDKGWDWFDRVQAWAKEIGIIVRFFHLGEAGAICVVSGAELAQPFGYVIGASIGETLERSALSALIEAARRSVRIVLRQTPNDALSVEDFLALSHPTFSDHGRLALDLEYAKRIEPIFNCARPAESKPREAKLSAIDVMDLNWPYPSAGECPFHFAKASSTEAQPMFLGAPSESKINLKRLEQFVGRPITFSDINPLPHPFD